MPTTSNFGWTTPADTDLVKDGAAAIRTLGNGIDTSMAELKGGTTGQVLSKTSNTDMDFTWVTTDDANAIQNAIVDAKGDLIAATANDTPARLAVGANETRLVADSAVSTGLKYVADTTNYAIAAKGDLLAGTAADTLTALTVGSDYNVLQALASAGTTGLQWAGASTTYTPTWIADSGSPSIGNGTLTGQYIRYGKLCLVRFYFKAGSTTTFGTSGSYYFGLPFTAAVTGTSGNAGSFYGEDAGVAGYRAICGINSSGVYFSPIGGTFAAPAGWGKTVPFTWATNDFIEGQLVYEVA